MSRWIAVSTDLLDEQHDLHPSSRGHEACKAFAWIDLIGMAAWRPHSGLERGQLRVTQHQLAERWNWHRSKVQRFLVELRTAGRTTHEQQANNKPDIITICQYDDYQPTGSRERTSNRSTNRSASRSASTYIESENSARTRARGNGERKPPRPTEPIDLSDAYADPDRIAAIRRDLQHGPHRIGDTDILEGLKRQVNGGS